MNELWNSALIEAARSRPNVKEIERQLGIIAEKDHHLSPKALELIFRRVAQDALDPKIDEPYAVVVHPSVWSLLGQIVNLSVEGHFGQTSLSVAQVTCHEESRIPHLEAYVVAGLHSYALTPGNSLETARDFIRREERRPLSLIELIAVVRACPALGKKVPRYAVLGSIYPQGTIMFEVSGEGPIISYLPPDAPLGNSAVMTTKLCSPSTL